MSTSTTTRLVTIADAARRAGVSGNSVRKWLDRQRVEAVPTIYGRAVDERSLEEFLRERMEREQRRGDHLIER